MEGESGREEREGGRKERERVRGGEGGEREREPVTRCDQLAVIRCE